MYVCYTYTHTHVYISYIHEQELGYFIHHVYPVFSAKMHLIQNAGCCLLLCSFEAKCFLNILLHFLFMLFIIPDSGTTVHVRKFIPSPPFPFEQKGFF